MLSKAAIAALTVDLPVLFAYIGWADDYDGTGPVIGKHRHLKTNPYQNTEVRAFDKGDDHIFSCGIGSGQTPTLIHVVFVALDPAAHTKKLVGLYAKATVEMDGTWAQARTSHGVLIPVDRRPKLSVEWPSGQGIRRWAKREVGRSYPSLHRVFERLKSDLPDILKTSLTRPATLNLDQTYSGMEAREGAQYERLVIHRRREGRLRKAKIEQALRSNDGRLVCEVPRCGFDFVARYGEIGYGYAHVHHRTPLADVGKKGMKTTVADLAIVCANCHAMVHHKGGCRDLKSLIPRNRKHRA
jgi:5-methylcytosine-specific restriction endonuclease McrA